MSAAAARRRKQLALKAAKAAAEGEGRDPITDQINNLLQSTSVDEATAYEALQLAQSQVRKSVNSGKYEDATTKYAYDIAYTLLEKHSKASVASQLLTLLIQVLNETHTLCTKDWVAKIEKLHDAYIAAVKQLGSGTSEIETTYTAEQKRLLRLHAKFLKGALIWSDVLGTTRYGAIEIHNILGDHLWALSDLIDEGEENGEEEEEDGTGGLMGNTSAQDFSLIGLKCSSIMHLSLAEEPAKIVTYLSQLPAPTAEEMASNRSCPPALRDSLLTRSILAMVSAENLRDATTLLTLYMEKCETRDMAGLKKSYLSKTDGKAPSHVLFNSMLISVCRKDKKTGPLYTWLIKSFGNELVKMYKPELLKAYTTKIGKVYFGIMPPPGMLATLESMMGMMGGAGGAGGMNPAMMQAMMGGAGMGGMH